MKLNNDPLSKTTIRTHESIKLWENQSSLKSIKQLLITLGWFSYASRGNSSQIKKKNNPIRQLMLSLFLLTLNKLSTLI